MLTIGGSDMGGVILSVPNHVVREQMYSFLVDEYANAGVFAIDLDQLVRLTRTMARFGNWKPVFQYIADELKRQSRIREFIDGEAHVKGFLLAYLMEVKYAKADDPIVTDTIGNARLRLITLVYRTWELEVMEEVEI